MATGHRTELAINGGAKAKREYATAQRFAGNELKYLEAALRQNTLFYMSGSFVNRLCAMMREYTSMPHAVACSSGSAAVQLGLIAAGIGPGDEVICTPNTDYGSVLGIIAEGAVPVFCDCTDSLQASADTVAKRISSHTKAVVVVHLAGMPAPVDEIVSLCSAKNIAVVEDCAQAWGTRLHGKQVGTFGLAGCYSLNDFKHISCGDGGLVVLRDTELYRRVGNYADKHYDRFFDRSLFQAHHGVNYRMSELQGAVACAQMEVVDKLTTRHHELGERMLSGINAIPGLRMTASIAGGYATYWWGLIRFDASAFTASRDEFAAALAAEGVMASSFCRYDLIQKPLFQNRIARPWLEGDKAMYPFVQPDGRKYYYSIDDTPTHKAILTNSIQTDIKWWHSDEDVTETIAAIAKVAEAFAR